ncbi:MAG: ABC transporter permease [Cyanobacteria bacterium SZAS LIN-2]|nr:ABC transporter permease [Cyanobacteria bacterium SZAS LIN-3]MBS1994840.1 ABC transporter permease [Cyanobacteria bacterium SZAS LIN-2]MBS2010182.1 ABC transporter permease [Cyanobacteria bacterium SZAS TMP-1]
MAMLNKFMPITALVVVYIIFSILAPQSFTSGRNLALIVRQTTIVGITALGMTLVIISGGIDLSVGSIVALVTVVVAWMLDHNVSPILAAAAALLVGSLCGAVNGTLITRLKLVPFIITLGTLLIFRGLAKGVAGEQKIDAPLSYLNELLAALKPEQAWMIVPPGVWILILLAILVTLMLNYTRFGLHTFAVGANEQAARLCGVSVEKTKLAIYTLSGMFAGFAGLMQFARLTVGDPTVAAGLELDAIAAVVIGGGSLAGGEGSVSGTMIGALIMTVIRAGCTQMGLSNWVQEMVTGAIIIGAVVLDRMRHKKTT